MNFKDWITCFRFGVAVGSAIKKREVFDAGFMYGWKSAMKHIGSK